MSQWPGTLTKIPRHWDQQLNTPMLVALVSNCTLELALNRSRNYYPQTCLTCTFYQTCFRPSELTPLELACKLGRPKVFDKIMELQKIELWAYSTRTCSLHPLMGLDTIKYIDKTEGNIHSRTKKTAETCGIADQHVSIGW